MRFERKPYIVYIKIDELDRITSINSDVFLSDVDGWIDIDRGFGDKYRHAQSMYLDKPIKDRRDIYRYKFENGNIVERTQEEMDFDYIEPEIEPTTEERVKNLEEDNQLKTAQIEALSNMIDFYEECIAEMAMVVYA